MSNTPLICGITGGIGSGKSTVSRIFSVLDIPVYLADEAGRRLSNESPQVVTAIKQLFGESVYEAGRLNRNLVAQRVFEDAELLQKLNDIIHPAVREDFKNWLQQQQCPYVIREAAILIETGLYKDCEAVVLVTAPEDIRIERVIARDGATREAVLERMKNQWTDKQKRPFASHVIENDGAHALIPRVMAIHREILRKAEKNQ